MKIRLGDLRRIIKEELNRAVLSEPTMRIENPTLEDYENYAMIKSAKASVDNYYGPDKSAAFEKLVALPDPTSSGYTLMHRLAETAKQYGIKSFDQIDQFIEENSHLQQEKPKPTVTGPNVYPDERSRTPGLTRFGSV